MDDGLPSVESTKRFLVLCEQYGSHKTVVRLIADGAAGRHSATARKRRLDILGTREMERAVDYLHSRRASPNR